MTFDDILEQATTLLKRQGRVSYGAIQRRFALTDDYLKDLTIELVETQRLAEDENGRILVWVGDSAGEGPEPPAQPDQTTPLATQKTQPTFVEPPPTATYTPETAERRQLTVMFIDLVGSTALSGTLDPEDFRDVVRAYESTCTAVIQRYGGHVAQLLGDGLLVYFGYPHAHADDAQRAVRTGLEISQAIGRLNTRLEQDKDIRLAVCLGIHTGLVVVGAMGGEGRQEHLALGETPNIAARIQGLAAPDTVAISEATARLLQGDFDCASLGDHPLVHHNPLRYLDFYVDLKEPHPLLITYPTPPPYRHAAADSPALAEGHLA